MEFRPYDPVWPARLAEWAEALAAAHDSHARTRLRALLWPLLFDALAGFLVAHASHNRAVSHEDLEDLASEKALDLLQRIESGAWNVAGRSSAEISGYVSSVARFGLVDRTRRERRSVALEPGEFTWKSSEEHPRTAESPSASVEAREFIEALRHCAGALGARARRIWLCRAAYEMSSREIGALPEIGMTPQHVDVVVQRARQAIRHCLSERGHDRIDLPPGAFVALWSAVQALDRDTETESGDG